MDHASTSNKIRAVFAEETAGQDVKVAIQYHLAKCPEYLRTLFPEEFVLKVNSLCHSLSHNCMPSIVRQLRVAPMSFVASIYPALFPPCNLSDISHIFLDGLLESRSRPTCARQHHFKSSVQRTSTSLP